MAFVIFADQLSAFVLWVSVLEAAAQAAPTAPPSDRSDREAHSSHHDTPCILRQVLSALRCLPNRRLARIMGEVICPRTLRLVEYFAFLLFGTEMALARWVL